APDSWFAVAAPTASANGYGTFTLTAAGVWTYTLDNSNASAEAPNVAAIVTGDTTGDVNEAGGVANGTPGTPTATGNLNDTDVDDPDNRFIVVGTPTLSDNGYGS